MSCDWGDDFPEEAMTTNKPTGEMHTPDPRVQAYTAQSATGEAARLLEQIAALSHDQWAGWIRYMFTKGRITPSGGFEIDADSYQRWLRQHKTDYTELPNFERESDRVEARRIVAVVDALLAAKDAEMAALRPLANIGRLAVAWKQILDADLAKAGTPDDVVYDSPEMYAAIAKCNEAEEALWSATDAHIANPATAKEEEL